MIAPATESNPQQNYIVITIGFKKGLNYPFVASHCVASAQIFQYLPKTLSYIFDNNADGVAVKQLVPFQSTSLDYIVTVAEVYFPKDYVSALNQSIQTSYSKFYFNTDPTANSLALLVDSKIPLIGLDTGSGLSSLGSSGSSGSSSSGDQQSSDSGSNGLSAASSGSFDSVQPNDKDANSKLRVVGTSSGISAAVYITVLLVGFRIYKQKKGNVNFATAKDGEIILPISERGVVSPEVEIEPEVLVNPVYRDPRLDRRMSYQSLNSAISGPGPMFSDYAELTFGYEDNGIFTVDEMDETMEEVESIIPTISSPESGHGWF